MTVPWLRPIVACFSPWRPGFKPRSLYMGFMMNKVALGQVFSEYFGIPCQFSFHYMLHFSRSSSGANIMDHECPGAQPSTTLRTTLLFVAEREMTRKNLAETTCFWDYSISRLCLHNVSETRCFRPRAKEWDNPLGSSNGTNLIQWTTKVRAANL
jgi:hypothetical protein